MSQHRHHDAPAHFSSPHLSPRPPTLPSPGHRPLAGFASTAAQEAAAALLGLRGDQLRFSGGGAEAAERMMLQPGGRALVVAAAFKQKSEAGESNNNKDLDLGGGAATPP